MRMSAGSGESESGRTDARAAGEIHPDSSPALHPGMHSAAAPFLLR